jgi:phosphatidylglycerophosphate synthase
MSKMSYSAFAARSERKDKSANDRTHFFSRHLSLPLAYSSYLVGLTPNGVTFVFLLCGIGSAISIYASWPIMAYLLWRLHLALDMADGTLARATQTFSPFAVGYDRTNHIIINTSILLAGVATVIDPVLANVLIVTFYLYYFFSRSFHSEKQSTLSLGWGQILTRNIFGLEGYVLAACVLVLVERADLMHPLAWLYSAAFFAMFLLKFWRIHRK